VIPWLGTLAGERTAAFSLPDFWVTLDPVLGKSGP
jgi:hypothetical protein